MPGRSNAFEISKRLGLSEWTIQNAKKLIDAESNEVENMIASLEKSRHDAEEEYKEAHEYLKAVEKLHQDMQKQMIEFYERKQEMYDRAENRATEVIEKAKKEAEEVMKDLRQLRFQSGAQIKEHEF